MEGHAAPRELTADGAMEQPPAAPRDRADRPYVLAVARAEDDEDVRRLLRSSAFGNDVSVSLEREPDSRLAGSIEGDVHDAIVARHRVSGETAAVASRSVRVAYLNGSPLRLGYFGQLRIDRRFSRRRGLLDAGFEFCRMMHLESGSSAPRLYLASVVAGNEPARRLLARHAPGSGWPQFEPVDTLVSLAIPVDRRRSRQAPPGVAIRRGSPELLDQIVACLERTGRRTQFCPRWTRADLLSPIRARGLTLDDFVVAMRADRVIGCAACWDQRAFKQVVVRGYSPKLSRLRPVINVLAPLTGTPALPAVGARVECAYLSHVALDQDLHESGDAVDPSGVLRALVHEALAIGRAKGAAYVVLGLSARSPWLPDLRRSLPHRSYDSILYAAFWADGESLAASLDNRPSHPELAIL
jgi:hypothetical protein